MTFFDKLIYLFKVIHYWKFIIYENYDKTTCLIFKGCTFLLNEANSRLIVLEELQQQQQQQKEINPLQTTTIKFNEIYLFV